jgi:hypothetical protein
MKKLSLTENVNAKRTRLRQRKYHKQKDFVKETKNKERKEMLKNESREERKEKRDLRKKIRNKERERKNGKETKTCEERVMPIHKERENTKERTEITKNGVKCQMTKICQMLPIMEQGQRSSIHTLFLSANLKTKHTNRPVS